MWHGWMLNRGGVSPEWPEPAHGAVTVTVLQQKVRNLHWEGHTTCGKGPLP